MKQSWGCASAVLLLSVALGYGADFKKDVLPILESSCAKCHMGGNSKGGLSLEPDRIASAVGGSGGEDLIRRISMSDGGEDVMPPKSKGLASRDVRLIKEWIEAGAPLEGEGMVAKAPEAAKAPQPLHGEWTNSQGTTITATLIRVEGDKALLKLANGTTYPYPIGQLSPESQAKVKAFATAAP